MPGTHSGTCWNLSGNASFREPIWDPFRVPARAWGPIWDPFRFLIWDPIWIPSGGMEKMEACPGKNGVCLERNEKKWEVVVVVVGNGVSENYFPAPLETQIPCPQLVNLCSNFEVRLVPIHPTRLEKTLPRASPETSPPRAPPSSPSWGPA